MSVRDGFDRLSHSSLSRRDFLGRAGLVTGALLTLGPGAAIVNTSSITGLQGSKELLDYSATKARSTPSPSRSPRTSWKRASA